MKFLIKLREFQLNSEMLCTLHYVLDVSTTKQVFSLFWRKFEIVISFESLCAFTRGLIEFNFGLNETGLSLIQRSSTKHFKFVSFDWANTSTRLRRWDELDNDRKPESLWNKKTDFFTSRKAEKIKRL